MNAPSTVPLHAEGQTLPHEADLARGDSRMRGVDGRIAPDPRGRHARV